MSIREVIDNPRSIHMNKQQILTNLTQARAILAEIPGDNIDLTFFKKETPCGTLACAAGWLALTAPFDKIMGLVSTYPDSGYVVVAPAGAQYVTFNAGGGYDFEWLDAHFGPDAFGNLFEARFAGRRDQEHPLAQLGTEYDVHDWEADISDKDLALWRFDRQIEFVQNMPE